MIATVDGVGPVGGEALYVEMGGSAADILIRGKDDADRAVRNIPFRQTRHRRHDLGGARLIVRAEQRLAVGSDIKVWSISLYRIRNITGVGQSTLAGSVPILRASVHCPSLLGT